MEPKGEPAKTDVVLQQQQQSAANEQLSPKILEALKKLSGLPSDEPLEIETCAISGVGENSYGLVLRVHLKAKAEPNCRFCILKIAPTNSARRNHMRVADYYAREVYMYDVVFPAYRSLLPANYDQLDLMANMFDYSGLNDGKEFIIFEDLTESNYVVGQRTQLPNLTVAAMALRALGRFHALSFALQAKEPTSFQKCISHLQPDNLFTPDIDQISIEFGKSYIRRARNMIEADRIENHDNDDNDDDDNDNDIGKHLEILRNVECHFKEICLRCVDGYACAPYAVICHGDFWTNNILNRYDENNRPLSTKLIDFQMARYGSPVLDLVHYLFGCMDSDLRGPNFQYLINDVYYASLEEQLQQYDLDVRSIFPHSIFHDQLCDYGIYGLCMAAMSLPFFIADATELFDLDKVSEAIADIGTSETTTKTETETTECEADDHDKDLNDSRLKLIEEDFNLLTERTAPIFKSRMAGVVADIVKNGIKVKIQ